MTVLVLTHSRDRMVPEWVVAAVEARGRPARRVDLDQYPAALSLIQTVADARPASLDGLPLDEVSAAWVRKLGPPRLDPALPPAVQAPVRREVTSHGRGLLDALVHGGARVCNAPESEAAIEGNKLRQLRLAQDVGLAVPPTLVTADPAAVREFWDRHAGDVVVKMLTSLQWSMEGRPPLPTQALTAADLDHLDGLRQGPMCFQRRVRARRELRVCWVDGRCFAGSPRATASPGDGVDWRRGAGHWERATVPPETAAALGRFMARAGLDIGSIDLMLPDDGPPVFLEVNPGGEWGMLQHALGFDIAGAIAALLVAGPARSAP